MKIIKIKIKSIIVSMCLYIVDKLIDDKDMIIPPDPELMNKINYLIKDVEID